MILKIFSPKNLAKKLAFFAQTDAGFGKKLIMTLIFVKKRQHVRRKLARIAENCDHNIDPRSVKINSRKTSGGVFVVISDTVKEDRGF
jgi:hypothetical protein